MFYNNHAMMFEAIGSRKEGYASQLQLPCYPESNQVVLRGEAGDGTLAQGAFDSSDPVDKALRYIASAMPSTLPMLLDNSQLYTLKDDELKDWPDVQNCQLATGFFRCYSRSFQGYTGTGSDMGVSSDYSGNGNGPERKWSRWRS